MSIRACRAFVPSLLFVLAACRAELPAQASPSRPLPSVDGRGTAETGSSDTSAGGTSAGGTSAGGRSAGGTSAGGTSAGGTSAGGTSQPEPAQVPPSGAQDKSEVEPGASAACPADMALVEGDYCSRVEHECLSSWYDKSNKKTVCERFSGKSTCVGTRTPKRFCIDRYEWPNKKGERPEVMNRFHQAEVKCAAVGKRLCTESEWTMACEGPKLKPFPYGFERNVAVCHGDVMWDSPNMTLVARRDKRELARLWKGVRSGSQPECVSDYGVYDLTGNADEVVSSETFTSDFRGKYDSVHTGGPWYKGVRNQCRPKIYTHDEGFYYYFLSFRCCAEPDGQKTDPRTTRQRKEKWQFDKVERIAGFSQSELRAILEKKVKDPSCGCGEGNIRCKTMCGSLLDDSAKDFDKSGRRGEGEPREP